MSASPYVALFLASVFVSSVSQVLLKKAALKYKGDSVRSYLNPLVAFGYLLLLATTVATVFAYKGVPLSMGPVLEATSYIYVTVFGYLFFHEAVTKGKIVGISLIVLGIILCASSA